MNANRSVSLAFALAGLLSFSSSAKGLRLFGRCDGEFGLPGSEFTNQLYVGALRDSVRRLNDAAVVLHVGFDFPLADMELSPTVSLGAGITPLLHLYLFPEGSVFHADNFYAVLSFYLAGRVGSRFAWRLYPVYHLSAHFSDGARVDYSGGRRKVSNEMTYATLSCRFGRNVEALLGGGVFYHTIARKEMQGMLVGACSLERRLLPALSAVAALRGELVVEDGIRPGGTVQIGSRLHGARGRQMDIVLDWYNRVHPGVYHTANEHGIGCTIRFIPGSIQATRNRGSGPSEDSSEE